MAIAKIFSLVPAQLTIIVMLFAGISPPPCLADDLSTLPAAMSSKPVTPAMKQKSYDFYRKAKDEMKALEDEDALRDSSKAIEADPTSINAYLLQGDCQSSLCQSQKAKDSYLTAFKLSLQDSQNGQATTADSLARMERYYRESHQLSECLKMWDMVVARYKTPQDYFGRGKCKLELGKIDAALSDFQVAKTQANLHVDADCMISDCFMRSSNYDKAIAAVSDAINYVKAHGNQFMSRRHYSLYERRARCYAAAGQRTLAEDDLRQYKLYSKELFDGLPFQSDTARAVRDGHH